MLNDMLHLPVNWIDGMKISRKHFEQTELFISEQLQDLAARQLGDFNFGVLPADQSLDLKVYSDSSQQINIELNACKAVTPNGSRIQVTPRDAMKAGANLKELAGKYGLQPSQIQNIYILVSVNPEKRIPTGEPVMDENPPRFPFTAPDQRIDIIPAEQINVSQLSGSLVAGKITYQNGELVYQKDYIPACTTVNSLAALTEWHSRFRLMLENWEKYCAQVIQKINSKTQSQQPNALANSIQVLSEKIFGHLMTQKLHYQWIVARSAPIYMFVSLLGNIQFVQGVLQCFPEKDKEEMLAYFAEWTEAQAGNLENQTLRILQTSYNHYDVAAGLQEILQAYNAYIQIFQKLSQLDFIGKKKGQNIFVIEQQAKDAKPVSPPPNEKTSSRWSPLS